MSSLSTCEGCRSPETSSPSEILREYAQDDGTDKYRSRRHALDARRGPPRLPIRRDPRVDLRPLSLQLVDDLQQLIDAVRARVPREDRAPAVHRQLLREVGLVEDRPQVPLHLLAVARDQVVLA